MIGKKTVKIIWFLIVLGMCIVGVKNAGKSCMGLTLVTEEELEQYSETLEMDISGLRFNGEKVAADLENNTIYISQSKTRFWHYSMLQGELSFQDLNYKIYFLEDSNIRNLAKTVKNGTPLSLVVVSDKEKK